MFTVAVIKTDDTVRLRGFSANNSPALESLLSLPVLLMHLSGYFAFANIFLSLANIEVRKKGRKRDVMRRLS